MSISIIVPLNEETMYAQTLFEYVTENSQPVTIKELIFVCTQKNQLSQEWDQVEKVRVLTFEGASHAGCLEAGAFEATGDVLFFLAPGTFPESNFDAAILSSIQLKFRAGVLGEIPKRAWLRRLWKLLPSWCLLCFIKSDNFFTTRRIFHKKSKLMPKKQFSSIMQLFHQYALVFRAQVIGV